MTKFITRGNWTLRITRRPYIKPWFNYAKGRAVLGWDTTTHDSYVCGTVWEVNLGRSEFTLIHYRRT